MFFTSYAICSINPCSDMGWKLPLQRSGLVGAYRSYGSWMLMMLLSSVWATAP